MIKKSVATR